jgi:hypothetical protein
MRLMKRALLALVVAVVPVAAFATHIPSGSEKIVYDGPLNPGVSVTGAIGWTDPKDGYDFYCMSVSKGKKVSLAAKRVSGDIKLNIGILNGLAKDGDTVSSLKTVGDTSNSETPDTTFSFTPDFDGVATVWVSTWLGENGGNYSLLMTGGNPQSACGTVTGTPGGGGPTGAIVVTVPLDPILVGMNQTVTVPVNVATNGISEDVSLSVTGLNNDVKTSFDKSTFPSPGNGDATLTLSTGDFTFPGTYFVTVTATSASGNQIGGGTFQFIVDCQPPFILGVNQPKGASVTNGQTASLSVIADGTGPLVYQWYQGYPGVTTTPVANGNGASVTTPAVNGRTQFWVRVSNACGTVDSLPATVTTHP